MRMGKTFFLTAAAVLLSLCVCACGNAGQAGNGSPAAKTEESTAEVSPQTPEQESAESQDEKVQEPAESPDENVQGPAEVQAGAEMQETAEAQADAEMQEDADMQAAADLQKNTDDPEGITELQEKADTAVPAEPEQEPEETPAAPTLLYMGQGSLRIVTGEGRVIYIDPYSGDGYDLPADLILVTHGHFDHNGLDLIQSRNEDCRIITQNEAIADGEHQSFDWDMS